MMRMADVAPAPLPYDVIDPWTVLVPGLIALFVLWTAVEIAVAMLRRGADESDPGGGHD